MSEQTQTQSKSTEESTKTKSNNAQKDAQENQNMNQNPAKEDNTQKGNVQEQPPITNTAPRNEDIQVKTKPTVYRVKVECSIRRKQGLVGLPGADPNERVYKLGASLDARTKKALKGISGDLEKLIMPEMVGIGATDYQFKPAVEEYWSNIGVVIPADESHLKEHEKGLVIKFTILVSGKANKDKIEGEVEIVDKMALITKGINKGVVELEDDGYSDFLLLSFALKHSRVAAKAAYVGNSPKIQFYVFNKATAIKSSLSVIETRNKAVELFNKIQTDETMLDAVLTLFDKLPSSYETTSEKIIEIDAQYNLSPSNMNKFISFVTDKNWDTKHLITLAAKMGKLNNPSNTTAYYYNQVLVGKTLEDAVLFLNSGQSDAENIKRTLKQEVNI